MEDKRQKKDKKLKTIEKVIADPYREYLDMDTDEEGCFERHETSESESETFSEPESPTYTEQELTTLVQYVKDLTVLSNLEESDWNEDCYKIIREYFQCVTHTIMIIFFNENNKLTASLNLFNCWEVELMYFLRSPLQQIYTPDNFLNTILCGSVNKDKVTSFYKFLRYIYAPIAVNDDWPEIIKNDLYMSLHNLLMVLNKWVCKSINRTILYVPKESLPELSKFQLFHEVDFKSTGEMDVDIPTQEFHMKELIERLEKIVRHWIKQIHEALAVVSIRKNIRSITDEQKHWADVYNNLSYLNHQLLNTEIKNIIQLLRNINSSSVESFPTLIAKLQAVLMESSSNVIYLNILSDYCRDICVSDEIVFHITKILLLMLLIWIESPFYNTKNNIENLSRALSIQIISQCQKRIDLEIVFKGRTDHGIQMLEECISTCRMYQRVYDNFIKNITTCISPYKVWDIDREVIFNNVTAFIQRCYDIIEICNARIIFERCTKTGTFGSIKGIEYEQCCQHIESFFYDNLNKIIIIKKDILNIEDTAYNCAIYKFRIAMVQTENMIRNLINNVFQNVKNIDEGIEAIYVFQRFTYRTCLRDLIHKKWRQVWEIFVKQIEMCHIHPMTKGIGIYHPLIKSFSKYSNVPNTKEHYLKMQYKKMISASYWMADCVNPRYYLERYKVILDSLEDDYLLNETSTKNTTY